MNFDLGFLNPVLQSTLTALADARQVHYDKVAQYRAYEEGDQANNLNDDQQTLLGENLSYKLNVCPIVLSVKCDRLKILGLTATLDGDTSTSDSLTEFLTRWWADNDMEGQSNDLHYQASRDGDCYLLVEYDNAKQRPRFSVEPAYDGEEGVIVTYINRQPVYALKRWAQLDPDDPTGDPLYRLNKYFTDRVERYMSVTHEYRDAGWIPYADDGQPPVIWHTDTGLEGGKPLGLPMFHFKNNCHGNDYGTSDLAQIVPSQQDALNVAGVSVVAASLLAGFPINYVFGLKTGSGDIPTYPGVFIKHEGNPQGTVTVGQFPAANILQLIEEETNIKRSIALLTSTPLPMLNPSSQIAAEGTLQQMEAPLIAKCENAQQDFGGAYVQALRFSLQLEQVYRAAIPRDLDLTKVMIRVLWKSPQTRNEQADATTMQAHVAMGVPEEMAWRKLGYTEDEIQEMKEMKRQAGQEADIANLRANQVQTTQVLMTADVPQEETQAPVTMEEITNGLSS